MNAQTAVVLSDDNSTSVEPGATTGTDLPAVQPSASITQFALSEIDEGFVTNATRVITMVARANKSLKPVKHPAVTKLAIEHDENELASLWNLLQINPAPSEEALPGTLRLLQIAKERAMVVLQSEAPADGEIGGGSANIASTKPAKAPKAPKAVKEPKAPKEPKAAKEPEPIVEAVSFEISSSAVTLKQERTKLVPMPAFFFTEADATLSTASRGHQVDPSRVEGYAPVMPGVNLHATSGNPYPVEPDATVVTADRYKPMVKVSHFTFEKLSTVGELRGHPDAEIVKEIVDKAGVPNDSASRACIQDTLRDLALFGLAKQFLQGKSRLFRI